MRLIKIIRTLAITFTMVLIIIAIYRKTPEIKFYFSKEKNINEHLAYKLAFEDKFYRKLSKLKILRRSYSPDNIREYMAQEGFDFDNEHNKIIEDSLNKLYQKDTVSAEDPFKIPLVSHKAYFSSEKNPKGIKTLYLEIMKASYRKLNLTGQWEHNIWTNLPDLFPSEITNIKGVKVRHINELKDHSLYLTLVNIVKKGDELIGHYSEASDTLRFMVMEKFGGMYNDMDYEIYHPTALIKLMKKFDFVGVAGINNYYESGFILAKPHHPILTRAVQLQERNHRVTKKEKLPKSIEYSVDLYRKIFFSGPPIVTVAYIARNNQNGNNDVLLPHWIGFNGPLAQYKNGSCQNQGKVTHEEFIANDKKLDQIIKEFFNLYKNDKKSVYEKYKPLKVSQHNIYYDSNYFEDIEIIGADMSCGTWSTELKGFERILYWKFPWQKNEN